MAIPSPGDAGFRGTGVARRVHGSARFTVQRRPREVSMRIHSGFGVALVVVLLSASAAVAIGPRVASAQAAAGTETLIYGIKNGATTTSGTANVANVKLGHDGTTWSVEVFAYPGFCILETSDHATAVEIYNILSEGLHHNVVVNCSRAPAVAAGQWTRINIDTGGGFSISANP
jgi:hypothetical protein